MEEHTSRAESIRTGIGNITGRPPAAWVLLLMCLVLWGGEFIRRSLWEPDEARYAYVAKEMKETGSWLVPHIYGEPYPDKPPLLFWMINAASILTGGHIGGVATRLPSLLGAFLTLWVVARLATRWHSVRAAWRSVAVLMTSYMFWHEGGWGRTDSLLCGLCMLSMYLLVTSQDHGSTARQTMGYVLAGLAALTKGPIGIVVPIGIYLVILSVDRDAKRPAWPRVLRGLAIAIAVPSIWLALAWLSGAPDDYFASMFTEKSFARITKSTGHARHVLYYAWHFPAEFLPWTLLLPAALATIAYGAVKRRLVAWFCFVLVLFSLFTCKRNIYILTAYPAAAMLIGVAWDDLPRLSRRAMTASGLAFTGLICCLGLAEAAASLAPSLPFDGRVLVLPAATLLSGVFLLIAVFRHEAFTGRWFCMLAGLLFAHQLAVSLLLYPAMNTTKSPTAFGAQAGGIANSHAPIYLFREQMAIMPLYANRLGKYLHSYEELQRTVSTEQSGIVALTAHDWSRAPHLEAGSLAIHDVQVGHKQLVWLSFTNNPTGNAETRAGQL